MPKTCSFLFWNRSMSNPYIMDSLTPKCGLMSLKSDPSSSKSEKAKKMWSVWTCRKMAVVLYHYRKMVKYFKITNNSVIFQIIISNKFYDSWRKIKQITNEISQGRILIDHNQISYVWKDHCESRVNCYDRNISQWSASKESWPKKKQQTLF